MEFELWYLLFIPVLFGAGWFARSFDIKEKKSIADETQTLYKGLDLLLSNKQDQAIDSFVRLTKIDPDTVELHFSLGGLFRRRGEFDRAIRIHNHLRNREDLSKKIRARALYELGTDYLAAGIWDRAEKAFQELSEVKSEYKIAAQKALINIYETEKEWQKAIDEANLLEKQTGEKFGPRIAQHYCELTALAFRGKDYKGAVAFLEKALEEDPQNKRALMMKGQMLHARGDIEGAIAAWKQVGQVSPAYETLVVEPIANALIEVFRKEDAVKYLEGICERYNNNDELDIASALLSKIDDPERAIKILQTSLKTKPSLIGFQRLVQLRLETDPDNEQLKQLNALLKAQLNRVARYTCSKCGFATRKFLWHCPGCHQWETFPPIRNENLAH